MNYRANWDCGSTTKTLGDIMAELKSHEILATLRKEMISWTETTFVWPIISSETSYTKTSKIIWKAEGGAVDTSGNLTQMNSASFAISFNVNIGKHVCHKLPYSCPVIFSFPGSSKPKISNEKVVLTENQGVLHVQYSCDMSILSNIPPASAEVDLLIRFYAFEDTLVINQTIPFIAIDGCFGDNTDDNNKILFSSSRNFSFKNGVGLVATHNSNITSLSLTNQGVEWISQNWEDTSGCEVWIAGLGYR